MSSHETFPNQESNVETQHIDPLSLAGDGLVTVLCGSGLYALTQVEGPLWAKIPLAVVPAALGSYTISEIVHRFRQPRQQGSSEV
jgi:hypothetical protein